MSGAKNSGEKLSFAREMEKCEKNVMGVVNGEKPGVAAVAVGKCDRSHANSLCDAITELLKKYPKGSFSAVFDGEKLRFDFCGDIRFAAEALGVLAESEAFGEAL